MIDPMPIDVELAKLEYQSLDSALGEATLRPEDEQVRCERAWHEARELAARWGPEMFQFITGERLTLFVGSGWETDAGPAPDSDFPNDRYIGFYSVGLVLRAGLAPLPSVGQHTCSQT